MKCNEMELVNWEQINDIIVEDQILDIDVSPTSTMCMSTVTKCPRIENEI